MQMKRKPMVLFHYPVRASPIDTSVMVCDETGGCCWRQFVRPKIRAEREANPLYPGMYDTVPFCAISMTCIYAP